MTTWNRWKGHEGRKKKHCKKQYNQQSKRLVQGQNRKGEQWKIQNPTPTRRTSRMATPKKSQTYEQTHQAADQHFLQSQNKNAASEKNNCRNKYRNHTCRACGVPVETQKHVLEDCEVLQLVSEYKVYDKEIFSDNPSKLRTTSTNIQNIMDQLNNIAENEATTTIPKQPQTKQTSTARPKKGLSPPVTRGSTWRRRRRRRRRLWKGNGVYWALYLYL